MGKIAQQKGKIIVISGPAGVGKGTIIQCLRAQCPEVHLSVSETTRAPRDGEVHGVHYYFVTQEAFLKRIDEGRYLEYNFHFDHSYATPMAYVQNELDAGHDIILEIEYKGAAQVKEKDPDALLIFILPPAAETLTERLVKRGTEDQNQMALRHQRALDELKAAFHYDYVIVNDDLDQAVSELTAIIAAEKNHQTITKNQTINMKSKIEEIIGGFNGLSE